MHAEGQIDEGSALSEIKNDDLDDPD